MKKHAYRKLIETFFMGYMLLMIAVGINVLGSFFNLPSWYNLLVNRVFLQPIDYVYLFIIYPFLLGCAQYVVFRTFKKM